MSDFPRCETCRHFITRKGRRLGSCDRWHMGYHLTQDDIADNEAWVEDDEGWGMMIGPKFGCVLHEVQTCEKAPTQKDEGLST